MAPNQLTGLIERWVDEFDAARDWKWPDDPGGTAAELLAQDLAEHLDVMAMALTNGRWAAAMSVQRLYFERLQVLQGALADAIYAEAYHEPLFNYPPMPLDAFDPKALRTKARSEDGLNSWAAAFNLPESAVKAEVDAHRYRRATSSYYFVHPSAMGPTWSRRVAEQDPREQLEQWRGLLAITVLAGLRLVWGASRSGTAIADSMLDVLDESIATARDLEWSEIDELESTMTTLRSRQRYPREPVNATARDRSPASESRATPAL